MCPNDPSEPLGPDSFGGSDEESHYAAPEAWRQLRKDLAEEKEQQAKDPSPRPPVEHELKTWAAMFNAIVSGSKTFELRFNDRDFRVGDILVLRDYDNGEYTGRWRRVIVTYMTDGAMSGALAPGFVCMSIAKIGP